MTPQQPGTRIGTTVAHGLCSLLLHQRGRHISRVKSSWFEGLNGQQLTYVIARYLQFLSKIFLMSSHIYTSDNLLIFRFLKLQVEEFREIAQSARQALRLENMNSSEGKSMIKRILASALNGIRRFGCGRGDDVVTTAYDMPEAPSSRPSMARTTQQSSRPPSYPRSDSSLLDRSQSAHISLPHGATQVSKIINRLIYVSYTFTTIT